MLGGQKFASDTEVQSVVRQYSNYGHISYPFQYKRRLSPKLQKKLFPTPVYFAPLLTGFPLELGICTRDQKTTMMALLDIQKSCNIVLVV